VGAGSGRSGSAEQKREREGAVGGKMRDDRRAPPGSEREEGGVEGAGAGLVGAKQAESEG